SYLSASEPVVTFGLGPDTKVDSAEVHWPSGTRQKLAHVDLDRQSVVEEPR
ncbi:MAG TPA: hypothetical protein DCE44_08305, partial [Verrucomicrobiales bacterium]|nr:hypothetical protein [Verrucomicrobiales bacterium]